jgi:microcystin-dependent protein
MEGYIGQIMIFHKGWIPENWMPCDGRSVRFKDYVPLAAVLSINPPEGIQYSNDMPDDLEFRLPSINSRHPDFNYIICVDGLFPVRAQ